MQGFHKGAFHGTIRGLRGDSGEFRRVAGGVRGLRGVLVDLRRIQDSYRRCLDVSEEVMGVSESEFSGDLERMQSILKTPSRVSGALQGILGKFQRTFRSIRSVLGGLREI